MIKSKLLGSLVLLTFFIPVLLTAQTRIDSSYKNTYYLQKSSHFRTLPAKIGATIFLGDSITDMGEWWELRKNTNTINRGISSDITYGILARLDEIVRHQPDTVFIMIGINDLARAIPIPIIIQNMEKIITGISAGSSSTKIILQSILPTNPSFTQFTGHQGKKEQILQTNLELLNLAIEYGLIYVDIHSNFINSEGDLKRAYTDDGLHLNGKGYSSWNELLKKMDIK